MSFNTRWCSPGELAFARRDIQAIYVKSIIQAVIDRDESGMHEYIADYYELVDKIGQVDISARHYMPTQGRQIARLSVGRGRILVRIANAIINNNGPLLIKSLREWNRLVCRVNTWHTVETNVVQLDLFGEAA